MIKNKLNRKNIIIIILILLISVIIFAIGIASFIKNINNEKYSLLNSSDIYENIYISNTNVSNVSTKDAIAILKEANFTLNSNIILEYDGQTFKYSKESLGFEYDFEKSVEEAYEIGRVGDENIRYDIIKSLSETPVNIELYQKIDETILEDKIAEIENALNKEPENATLIKVGNSFEVIEGTSGLKLNREKLINDIKSTLDEYGDIYLALEFEEVEVTNTEDLKKVKDQLGTFSTSFANTASAQARITNLKVASSNINGTVLYPGEVFSTNAAFGETTSENGYQAAGTIVNGKIVDDYGGGVCQVSSTLYNAVLYSELEVVERTSHSLKVGYLDYGYDAVLAGDYLDFKFKNSSNYPIYIESYVTESQVICTIYGYEERPQNREIKFENSLISVVEPGDRIETETDELPLGTEKVTTTALNGYKYNLYKLVYVDGNLVEKVLVNNSYYKPRAAEVLIGTNTESALETITLQNENIQNENTQYENFVSEDNLDIIYDLDINDTPEEISNEPIEIETEMSEILEDIVNEPIIG